MATKTPTICRIVRYRLSSSDIQQINKRRQDYRAALREAGGPTSDGYQAHVGNDVQIGQVYPAMIARVWSVNPAPGAAVNLQVFLDGNDTYWATSRAEGPGEGQWEWPEY